MTVASSLPFATLALAACKVGQELDGGTLHDDNDPAAEDNAYGASASFVSGSATFTTFASINGDQDHCGIGAALDPGRWRLGN